MCFTSAGEGITRDEGMLELVCLLGRSQGVDGWRTPKLHVQTSPSSMCYMCPLRQAARPIGAHSRQTNRH